MYIAAFPDMRVPIEDVVAEGDKVAVRWALEATHQGAFLGILPTGKRIRMNGISILRPADGKIAEQWEQSDRMGLLQQLGVIPAPEHSGT
jgi:predicted ester cyclase